MTQSVGVGQFIAWNGGCIFIGRHDSPIPIHAHQAIQIVAGSNADFRIRAGEDRPWLTYAAGAIPSRQPHGLDVTDSDFGAVIFVEPETREGRAISEFYLRDGIAEVSSDAVLAATGELFATWLDHRGDTAVTDSARAVVQILARGLEAAIVTDPRILSAIAYVNEHLAETITLEAVSSHACLSPSRFRHLFVEQTGMGLRPYVLWRRFLLVWDLLSTGESLSTAAHSAGFADAAHLTRTSKRTFGFAPSAMQVGAGPPARPHETVAHPLMGRR